MGRCRGLPAACGPLRARPPGEPVLPLWLRVLKRKESSSSPEMRQRPGAGDRRKGRSGYTVSKEPRPRSPKVFLPACGRAAVFPHACLLCSAMASGALEFPQKQNARITFAFLRIQRNYWHGNRGDKQEANRMTVLEHFCSSFLGAGV